LWPKKKGIALAFFYTAPPLKLKYLALAEILKSQRPITFFYIKPLGSRLLRNRCQSQVLAEILKRQRPPIFYEVKPYNLGLELERRRGVEECDLSIACSLVALLRKV
jgi:hypothetical protein